MVPVEGDPRFFAPKNGEKAGTSSTEDKERGMGGECLFVLLKQGLL